MDIRLPGENGLVLTAKIKAIHPDITIAILTSYNLPEYRIAAEEAGAEYFLVKGVAEAGDIIEMVRSAFSRNGND
jgi:DNA-binding NarL/FixJ family response regulator